MRSEQDLARHLEKARAGDTASLGVLCAEAKVRLQLVVKYRLGQWREADREDLVQDVLLTFCDKIQEIERTPMAFALWILRQKIGNEFQKAYRSRERSFSEAFGTTDREGSAIILEPPDPGEDVSVAYDRQETLDRLRAAISQLSLFCQTVFAGILEGMRLQEIWEQIRTVEPRLQRSAFDKRTHDCRRKLFARMGALE